MTPLTELKNRSSRHQWSSQNTILTPYWTNSGKYELNISTLQYFNSTLFVTALKIIVPDRVNCNLFAYYCFVISTFLTHIHTEFCLKMNKLLMPHWKNKHYQPHMSRCCAFKSKRFIFFILQQNGWHIKRGQVEQNIPLSFYGCFN